MSDTTRAEELQMARVLEYRRTLGAFMTGVTIVTTVDANGLNRGMTMNSFTSVSLDPPLVLVCVARKAASYDAFVSSRGIAVHILGSEQQDLARIFGSKSPDKFAGITTKTGRGGAPLIDDVHAWLDCETDRIINAGDHAVLIARVVDFAAHDRRPLGFYQGKFNGFSTDEQILQQQIQHHARTKIRWVIETEAQQLVVTEAERGAFRLPFSSVAADQLSDKGLTEAATASVGCGVEIDFLYAVYDGTDGKPELVYRGRIVGPNDVPFPTYTLIPTVDAPLEAIADESEKAVVNRYVNERIGAAFGIYAGTQNEGAIATLAPSSR